MACPERLLLTCRVELIRSLSRNIPTLLDHMQAEELVTGEDKQIINSKITDTEKAREILDLVQAKGGNTCQLFVDMLLKLHQIWPDQVSLFGQCVEYLRPNSQKYTAEISSVAEKNRNHIKKKLVTEDLILHCNCVPAELVECHHRTKFPLEKKIKVQEMFTPASSRGDGVPRLVIIEGHPGTGKTTLVKRMISDWASSQLYTNFKFAFYVFLEELSPGVDISLVELIRKFCDHLTSEEVLCALADDAVLLIFDGVQDFLNPPNAREPAKRCNPLQPMPMSNLVDHLIRGSLLANGSILLLTRPEGVSRIPASQLGKLVEIKGFSDSSKLQVWAQSMDEAQRNAIAGDPLLWDMCSIPAFCAFLHSTVLTYIHEIGSITTSEILLHYFRYFIAHHVSPYRYQSEDLTFLQMHCILKTISSDLLSIAKVASRSLGGDPPPSAKSAPDIPCHQSSTATNFVAKHLIRDSLTLVRTHYAFPCKALQEFFASIDLIHEIVSRGGDGDYSDILSATTSNLIALTCGFLSTSCSHLLEGLLDFDQNQADDKFCSFLVQWIKRSYHEAPEEQEGDKLFTVMKCLHANTALQLIPNFFSGVGPLIDLSLVRRSPADCATIAYTLSNAKDTTHLDLSECKIGPEGYVALSSGITHLHSLRLQWNGIGDKGAKEIAAVIEQNCTLTYIGLAENVIEDEGAFYLSKALMSNTVLKQLNLYNNHFGPLGIEEMEKAKGKKRDLIIMT
uniref:NLR family CARD domain-containing protein 3-like n=1 Tax=Pristiophorus japonicus TaxID=55135 RepID=UPI00398EC466